MAAPSKIIVTGAAQGLGRAVALRLATPGLHVAVWDTKTDGAEETARLCRERGAVSRAWTVDVGAEDQVEGAVADFIREWGRLTVSSLMPVFSRAPVHSTCSFPNGIACLRANLTGTFLCARAAARGMIQGGGGGAIVTMASGRALAGAANGAHYSATKGGIISLTKSLALDWAAYGIRVNCVIPGISDTAQPRAEMSDDQLYAVGARIPLGRIGQPEDIAGVVAFLLGSDAAYMTGQSVAVNGGAIMIP